ncbi:MAG TPA: hypothetical protein VF163_11335 [Micromonosporaceae bacterium]
MRPRSVLIVAITLVLSVGAGLVLVRQFGHHLPMTVGKGCTVSTGSGTVALTTSQMANAATIAAVGIRRNLPERAIVVALATAFQESRLENVSYGDRDSVGLFQQRPSQGWGDADQIQDPRYAADKFYSALVKVRGWQDLRITEAAQRVQRSAYPEAYQRWSDESEVLVEALAGRATSAVSCGRAGEPPERGLVAAQALGHGLRLDWGSMAATATAGLLGVEVTASQERVAWQYAHWLVAHSAEKGVERVRYRDQEWTARSGAWRTLADPGGDDRADRVVAEVYQS